MTLSLRRFGWASLALFGLAGCMASEPTPPATPAPAESKPAAPAKPEGAPAAQAEPAKLTDEEIAQIKKLPAEDQTAALAQMVCPVSGGHLGMDVPIKKVVDGKTLFLCCSGCEDDFNKDPKGVLAKLEKK